MWIYLITSLMPSFTGINESIIGINAENNVLVIVIITVNIAVASGTIACITTSNNDKWRRNTKEGS